MPLQRLITVTSMVPHMTMIRLLPLLLLPLVPLISLQAQQRVPVRGVVRDATTREPVTGATVRLQNGSRGTYTARDGTFRLPLEPGSHRLAVSSIGYESAIVSVTTAEPVVEVLLKSSSVSLSEISVSADMSAEEVVRNAIARKQQNERRLKTFSGLLYTKSTVDINGNAFGALPDAVREIILETFSRYWYDRDRTPGTRIEVIQRRQTANFPSESNLIALGNFVSFYADEITLLNARVTSPLADDAFSRYRYEIAGRSVFRGDLVYDIRIIPTTTVLPAFVGSMKIVKGSYSLVEIDVRPTNTTAVAFAKNLSFVQRFDRIADSTWWPTFLEIAGGLSVEIVKGFATIDAGFRITSIFTETVANEPLPDSVFATQRLITAAADADSALSEFWEHNALSELTEEEKATYARVDSIVAEMDTTAREDQGAIRTSVWPVVEFNRVSGVLLGAQSDLHLGPVDLGVQAAYAPTMKRLLGEVNIAVPIMRGDLGELALEASGFTRLNQNAFDAVPPLVNTIAAALFHRDYGDWYRQIGWSAGFRAELAGIRVGAMYERSEQYSEMAHATRSIFVEEAFRANPAIVPGTYGVISARAGIGIAPGEITISSGERTGAGLELRGVSGERRDGPTFSALEARGMLELPTLGTGYLPMLLKVGAQAGIGTAELPLQYQFRMRTRLVFLAPQGHFVTAPIGLYGGNSYVAADAEHNFSDIVWRWMGLPTYWGRGVEFILSGAAGIYRNDEYQRWLTDPSAAANRPPFDGYIDTGEKWYTEVGFGLGRIPTFISNVIYLRADARVGVGELARGNWGVAVTVSSPF